MQKLFSKRLFTKYFKAGIKNSLSKPGREWLYGKIITIYSLIKKQGPSRIFFDDGVWVHQYKKGSIVDRRINFSASLSAYENNAKNYWFFVYKPRLGDIIFDIGAGKGEDTYCFSRSVGPDGKIISVEANPKTFLCLSKFCEYNNLRNVIPVAEAICEKESEIAIDDPDDDLSSTIMNAINGFKVKGVPLDTLVKTLGIETIDFLKMNIEGAEKIAIRGMADCIKKTRYVCISCHDFLADRQNIEAMRTKDEVIEFLRQNGFRVIFRESDERPWIRDQINGINESLVKKIC
ncbi:MAG: FkbM family methyltransferase [bacterium]|nr:FkbM family methyltransferase [bacterium]